MPSNKGMKLTRLSAAPGRVGGAASCALGQNGRTALQLIPGVGQTMTRATRIGVLGVLAVGLLACDTMIESRIIIQTPASKAEDVELQTGLSVVREALRASGLHDEPGWPGGELWVWHDPQRPPDLHVTIATSFGLMNVHLQQGLFGPIGPTAKYSEVRAALLETARRQYGKTNVKID